MTKSYKTAVIVFLLLAPIMLFLSGCDQIEASSDVQQNDAKAEISAKDQAVIDHYQRLCASLQVGLDNLASDIQDISAIEAKQNRPSANGSLLSVKLADINRGLSAACNNKENLDVSLNAFATAVASFDHVVERTLTTQPDKTDIDRRLADSYREVARKLSGLTDDMNKLISIAPDYKSIVDTTN
jgi:septal ring factor EnvC (AmiA/AmiB activator)